MRLTTTRAAAALALLLAPAAPGTRLAAQTPTTITFAEYASPVSRENIPAAIGDPARAGGFDFYSTDLFWDGARNALGTWGTGPNDPGFLNRPTNLGASTALAGTFPGVAGSVDMYVAGDDPLLPTKEFNLHAIDVAHLFSTAYTPVLESFTLIFFGAPPVGAVVRQSFTIPVPAADANGLRRPVLQTLRFDGRWHNLENVWWSQGTVLSQMHQFTNVQAAVVPEPGTVVLLATGLAGLALAARRRR